MARRLTSGLFSCVCRGNSGLLRVGAPSAAALQTRWYKRWRANVNRQLYWKRIAQGPEPERPRSAWANWNYEAELYAFIKRLGEDLDQKTLAQIFTHRSHVEREKQTRSELELEDNDSFHLDDNSSFIQRGEELSDRYVKAYLRNAFPALPEEGICAITSHLMSDSVLAHVSRNLGTNDLILTAEFPVAENTLSDSLKAVIGGLADGQGVERAELFVQDFILTQLVGKDIMEFWDIVNPMGVLQGIVVSRGGADVQSRLMFETGKSTVLAAFMVGVYSDKKLLGKGYGETASIAEEMAARDALREIFGTTISRAPLPLGTEGRKLTLDHHKVHASLQDLVNPALLQ